MRATRKHRIPKRHSRRRIKGGDFVGQGSYGCGYTNPGLKCEGNADIDPRAFSKIMRSDDATKEYELVRHIRIIDPRQLYSEYTSKPPCKVDPVSFNTYVKQKDRRGNYKCRFVTDDRPIERYRVLQSKNAGVALDTITHLDKESYVPFFSALENLFKGLVHYHSHNFYHMDIKAENVVIDKVGTRYRAKYIDFGFSLKMPVNIDEFNISTNYLRNYFAWPYDLRFIDTTHRITQDDYDTYVRKTIGMHRDGYIVPFNYLPRPWLLQVDGSNRVNVLFYLRDVIPRLNTLSPKDYLHTILSKTDVYSLGLLFSNIFFRIFRLIITRIEDQGTFFPFTCATSLNPLREFPPNLLPDDLNKYYTRVYETLGKPAVALITYMTHPNVFERVDAGVAHRLYREWLGILRGFMDKELDNIPSLIDFFPETEPDISPVAAPAAAPVAPAAAPVAPAADPLAAILAISSVTPPMQNLKAAFSIKRFGGGKYSNKRSRKNTYKRTKHV